MDDNSFLKEVPVFARNLFTDKLEMPITALVQARVVLVCQINLMSKRSLMAGSPVVRSNIWKLHRKMLMTTALKWACSTSRRDPSPLGPY